MSLELNQFLPTFVEESLELLIEGEKILLALEGQTTNSDSIHPLFRIMHTLKGTSSIFNFIGINQLAHTIESFLDSIRKGKHELTQSDIDLLLQAVDVLRTIVTNIKNNAPYDDAEALKLNTVFSARVEVKPTPSEKLIENTNPEIKKDEVIVNGWNIEFRPPVDLFQKKGECARIFNVLQELGPYDITIHTDQLPEFKILNPELCYLSWTIQLHVNIAKNEIIELFSWVTDSENIIVTPLEKPFDNVIKKEKMKETKPSEIDTSTNTTVRVKTAKIDNLIDMMGEFMIAQSMINQVVKEVDSSQSSQLIESLAALEENARELQNSIMNIRMLPIEFVFNRFPRMIHDLAKKLGKEIELKVTGEKTELDKNMMEKLIEPLLHLIRNAIDHGIESPDLRASQMKSRAGTIELNANQEGGNIVIRVKDDGRGLNKNTILSKAIELGLIDEKTELTDETIYQLIFLPGLSTASSVSDISGRGVGLDIVAKTIRALSGEITIQSQDGKGTSFIIKLPLTLAIMDCQIVKIEQQLYAIPLMVITEIIRIDLAQLNKINNHHLVYFYRENYIAVILLQELFNLSKTYSKLNNKFLIVTKSNDKLSGLVIDELLSQQQIVIKNLEQNYTKVAGISGVTLLGNGEIALILDVNYLCSSSLQVNVKDPTQKTMEIETQEINSEEYNAQEPFLLLVFLLGKKSYGIHISNVKEIISLKKITNLPNSPLYIKGIINVRGTIVPIIDLHDRFNLTPSSYGPESVIILLKVGHKKERTIGIIVEKVLDTVSLTYNDINPLPENQQFALREHIRGLVTVNNQMVTVLNTSQLIERSKEQEMTS